MAKEGRMLRRSIISITREHNTELSWRGRMGNMSGGVHSVPVLSTPLTKGDLLFVMFDF